MPQIFSSSSTTLSSSDKASQKSSEKRAFTGIPLSTNRQTHGPNSQVSSKIRNFFRINSNNSKDDLREKDANRADASPVLKNEHKFNNRKSKLLPKIGRNRSTTVASEGNALDDGVSPTANVNPYFQHQGPPALRHHNDSSVPPSPPDNPEAHGKADASVPESQLSTGKDDLARKLRRVASAPNAQGLFSKSKPDSRPQSGASTDQSLGQHSNSSTLSVIGTASETTLLSVPPNQIPTPGQIRNSLAYRRTYSSNSIKVRNVEVGPGSFDKVKLIGKGDVGKVYLVKERRSERLYAMKGISLDIIILGWNADIKFSVEQERNDQT